jgi:hypothetical protein
VERTGDPARGEIPVSCPSEHLGVVGKPHDGVEVGIHVRDALEARGHELGRGDLAGSDERRELGHAPGCETIDHQTSPGRKSHEIGESGSSGGEVRVRRAMMKPSSSGVRTRPASVRTALGPRHVNQPSRS